jgi:hypothetical protein
VQRAARIWLLVVSALNGAAGLVCGLLLIARPDGSLLGASALLPVIRRFPLADVFFQDMLWIGVAMLLALGLPNLIALVALLRRMSHQYLLSLAAAVLLMLWCGFEMPYMFNYAALGYFFVGAISAACSVWMLGASREANAQQAHRVEAHEVE